MTTRCTEIAKRLATRLEVEPRGIRSYFESLSQVLEDCNKCMRLVDMGCGAAWLGSWLLDNGICTDYVGVDTSATMLDTARRRDRRLRLINASALRVPLQSGSMNTVVLEHAIHWIRDLPRLAAECQRVTNEKGKVVIVTSDAHAIETLWEYQLFPEALAIERRRLHPIEAIDRSFAATGFVREHSHTIPILRRRFDDSFVRHMRMRRMSSLLMIPTDVIVRLEERIKAARPILWGTTQEVSVTVIVFRRTYERRDVHA